MELLVILFKATPIAHSEVVEFTIVDAASNDPTNRLRMILIAPHSRMRFQMCMSGRISYIHTLRCCTLCAVDVNTRNRGNLPPRLHLRQPVSQNRSAVILNLLSVLDLIHAWFNVNLLTKGEYWDLVYVRRLRRGFLYVEIGRFCMSFYNGRQYPHLSRWAANSFRFIVRMTSWMGCVAVQKLGFERSEVEFEEDRYTVRYVFL